jgi:hypothetical protein
MKLLTVKEFNDYITKLKVKRAIKLIQMHHTYSPSYKQFTGHNHIELQKAMKNHHVKNNGWSDIGQHFTIFPDGKICTGRSMESSPAGVRGANSGAICIECLGNFDIGGDEMTATQKDAIAGVVKILTDKFKLDVSYNVIYHAWYSADGRDIGDYVKGHSVKTCPGTNFFGGNGLTAFMRNFVPAVENWGKNAPLETGNDIVWELMNNHGIEITEVQRAVKTLDAAKKNSEFASLYWIIYKFVNKGRM